MVGNVTTEICSSWNEKNFAFSFSVDSKAATHCVFSFRCLSFEIKRNRFAKLFQRSCARSLAPATLFSFSNCVFLIYFWSNSKRAQPHSCANRTGSGAGTQPSARSCCSARSKRVTAPVQSQDCTKKKKTPKEQKAITRRWTFFFFLCIKQFNYITMGEYTIP